MRRPAVLAALLGSLALVLRRSRAQRAERDLWTEAAAKDAPDLR
ncbi:MAG: DLW-39 family protein [Mycobacteriales bacterium]